MSKIACWELRINEGVMCMAVFWQRNQGSTVTNSNRQLSIIRSQNQDLLKKAWDAEGSPFKGTPFDPQAINLNGGGV